jgi:hypothetical protein
MNEKFKGGILPSWILHGSANFAAFLVLWQLIDRNHVAH